MQAPEGFIDVPQLEAGFLEPFLEASAGDGQHMVAADPSGDLRLWVRLPEGTDWRLAVLIPLDTDFRTRIEGALRLHRRWNGAPAGPPPKRLSLTSTQRRRLILMLRAIDGRMAGATYREIASVLLDPRIDALPARDWKSSAAHSQIYRWVTDALRLIKGGYRDLLKGEWP